ASASAPALSEVLIVPTIASIPSAGSPVWGVSTRALPPTSSSLKTTVWIFVPPRSTPAATVVVAMSRLSRNVADLHLLPSSDHDLGDHGGREQAVLDDADGVGEPPRQFPGVLEVGRVIGDHPPVGASRHVPEADGSKAAERGAEAEVRQLERHRGRQPLDELVGGHAA